MGSIGYPASSISVPKVPLTPTPYSPLFVTLHTDGVRGTLGTDDSLCSVAIRELEGTHIDYLYPLPYTLSRYPLKGYLSSRGEGVWEWV